ncbi:MAG: hypothetical protein RL754_470 [Bacteroidota bacterium]
MSILSSIAFALALSTSLTSCSGNTDQAVPQEQSQAGVIAKNVNADEFAQLVVEGKGLVLDVRTPGEYAQGHLKNSTLLNIYDENFAAEISKLDKDTPVYVYCRSGNRSGQAMRAMQQQGFKEVYNLQGGIGAWMGKGFEVVR